MSDATDDATLTAVVGAFEERLVDGDEVDWQTYLPSCAHPRFRTFALEVVLVDIHHRWKRGSRETLSDYLARLPPGFRSDREWQRAVAQEEWRCRRDAGESVGLADLLARYGLPPTGGESVRRSEEHRALSVELDALLARNSEPFGFRIVEALGRGELSRVFLAEQLQIGRRAIVVKVGIGHPQEIEALGRLHHENIVPLYGAERAPPYYVLWMPYFGRTTLAHYLCAARMSGRPSGTQGLWESLGGRVGFRPRFRSEATLEEAALWVAAKLARGLDHAHGQGVVHGDVKPANVLLADTGQPMLLDFNLASIGGGPAVGGTAPYMSPEQVRQFFGGPSEVGARSDVFSLGVVLYELVVGRLPFPHHPPLSPQAPARMLDDRSRPPAWKGRSVSPSLRSIVETCLAFDPGGRYQTCGELARDIERHLDGRLLRRAPNRSPLEAGRKQVGRALAWLSNPRQLRLVVAGAVLGAAGGTAAVHQGLAASAAARRADLATELESIRFHFALQEGGLDRTIAGLRAVEVAERAHPLDVDALRGDVLLWIGCRDEERRSLAAASRQLNLLAAHALAPWRGTLESPAAKQGVTGADRELLQRSLSRFPSGSSRLADQPGPDDDRGRLLEAVQHILGGRLEEAKGILDDLADHVPNDFWVNYWKFRYESARGEHREAAAHLRMCLALRPGVTDLRLLRATSLLKAGDAKQAEREALLVVAAGHEVGQAGLLLATARWARGNPKGALDALDLALSHGRDGPGVRLLAARLAAAVGDRGREEAEQRAALAATPRTAGDWMTLAYLRLRAPTVDWKAVEDAASRAADLDPLMAVAVTTKAFITLRRHKNPAAAAEILSQVSGRPAGGFTRALHAEAVAESGRVTEAREMAAKMLHEGGGAATWGRVVLILARCARQAVPGAVKAGCRQEAVTLIRRLKEHGALSCGFLADPVFDCLTSHPEFASLKGWADGHLPPGPPPSDAAVLLGEIERAGTKTR